MIAPVELPVPAHVIIAPGVAEVAVTLYDDPVQIGDGPAVTAISGIAITSNVIAPDQTPTQFVAVLTRRT